MELTFNTKTYKTMVRKNATIYSNDLVNSQSKIYVSAKVYEAQDASLPVSWMPDRIDFNRSDREFDVVVSNKGAGDLILSNADMGVDGLSVDINDHDIKPGKEGKIKFKWTGDFPKEHLERSVTFSAMSGSEVRFTVPFKVEGTDPTPPRVSKNKISPTQNKKSSPSDLDKESAGTEDSGK